MPIVRSEVGPSRKVDKPRVPKSTVRRIPTHIPQANLQRLITAIPLVLVNAVAVFGQRAWAHQHLASWGKLGQILVAVALESIALFLAYHAFLAEQASDSAFKLKLSSYGYGAGVGILNYSHFAPDWRPNATAVTVGLMSASSPWLWATYSRRRARNKLPETERKALKLGSTRWLWHPIRSAQVMWLATWTGESNVSAAVAMLPQKERQSNEHLTASSNGKVPAGSLSSWQ